MSLDLTLPDDWRTWDPHSKDRLLWRLKAEAIIQRKVTTFCTDATPSAMAGRILGDRWHQRNYHDVLDQMALDLESGVIEMATISTPPQIGKSTWVNWYVAWRMARHPEDPIIRMSYAASLAIKHGRSVQGIIEDYGGQFGLLEKKGAWAQGEWETRTGAALRSGGMLTGVAGYPASLMLLDDPISGRAQADSEILRDKIWDEYSGSLVSRMRPGSPLLIVACLTGDTPVLMADGTERPISDVRPGDSVATYEEGQITTAAVKNWANQGPDHVYALRMASGRTARANARHPFLTVDANGVEKWLRTDQLAPGG